MLKQLLCWLKTRHKNKEWVGSAPSSHIKNVLNASLNKPVEIIHLYRCKCGKYERRIKYD
jgi:hypothetical protein